MLSGNIRPSVCVTSSSSLSRPEGLTNVKNRLKERRIYWSYEMFRAAALLIVLALSATPVAGIVCDLNCESHSSSRASHIPECHAHAASPHGAAIQGVHICDHDVNCGSFVVKGQESLVGSAAMHAIGRSLSMASDNGRIVASVFATSPPGASALPSPSRITVLRI